MKLFRILLAIGFSAFLATNFPLGMVGVYARFPAITAMLLACAVTLARVRMTSFTPLLVSIYAFLTYSFVTTFWTENVWLSLVKWLLYLLVAMVFLLSGAIAGQNASQSENPFASLKWPFLALLISSVLSIGTGFGWVEGNFRGMSGNSNALGASLMLTSPWLLYEIRRSWTKVRARRWLVTLSGATAVVLIATHSRAAIFGFSFLLLFAARQLSITRKFTLVYVLLVAISVIFAFQASAFDFLYHSFVAKRAESITASRGTQMEESWNAAKQGGAFGEGFGVSVGMSRYWDFTTFSRSAREKGNSFLAIVEETGIVGLVFYLGVLAAMWTTFRRLSKVGDRDRVFICNIGMGYMLAALLHSQFEAWFLSFGPDVSVYWGVIGLALGAATRKSGGNDWKPQVEKATRTRVFIPAPVPRA